MHEHDVSCAFGNPTCPEFGAPVVDRGDKCNAPRKRGWYCTRGAHLDGPCAALPKWWNLRWRYWYWMSSR